MKELIGKLSRGIIEYDSPLIETSLSAIELSVEAGKSVSGSFNVYSNDGYPIKGIVYSTQDAFKIVSENFITHDGECEIKYCVECKSYEPSMAFEGRINIVSNGGEIYIPFSVKIASTSVSSSIGEIWNLFHFVNLVKQDYDEAMGIFVSDEFKDIFLRDDIAAKCMYEGLIKSVDKSIALEEFIVGINKKQPVKIDIIETEKNYDNLLESYGDTITLVQNTWGYQVINVQVDGEFIVSNKRKFSTSEFAGNKYEYEYLIDIDKLHSGLNLGKIIFWTISQEIECKITIENSKNRDSCKSSMEIKKCVAGITEKYLNFRLHTKGVENWLSETLELVNRARSIDDENCYFKLLQAQICISRKNEEDAAWLLDSVADEILDKRDENIQLYCYYLYVRTLQKRDFDYTIKALDTIKGYYENGFDSWELLWILLYIDSSFENNKSLKIARIKEQYRIGCHSPLMYYEALYVFNKQPVLLRMINSFELQVINFGNKYNAIDLRLAIQISELSMLEKGFRQGLFNVLTGLYEKFENKTILIAVITMLIRGNKRENKYFKWYELGILADLKITNLYEYYVFSMSDSFQGSIPNNVLMYFVSNGSSLYGKEGFFYNKVIENGEKIQSIYKNYESTLKNYVLDKLRSAEIDDYIAILYNKFLDSSFITEENVKALNSVLNTWKISGVSNLIGKVIIIHKEINGEVFYKVSKGIAYVNIFTEDAIVLFEDIYGNIYMNNVEYEIRKLYDSRELNQISMEQNKDNIYLMAETCEQSLKYHKNINCAITAFKEITTNERYRRDYCDSIIKDIIEFYFSKYDGDELDEYLESIDITRLNFEIRNKVVELMIMRGLYNQVADILKDYGICELDARRVLKYCSRVIKNYEDIFDFNMVKYCNYAFSRGKYNENTLSYLTKYYNGTTKEMLELWRISRDYSYESRELEERIISQILFSRTHIGSMVTVYESYYKKGVMEEIKKAYLFFMSNQYFIKENPVEELFFIHLENELMSNDNIMDLCKCAYLMYCSKKNKLTDKALTLCKNTIEYLEKKNIIFNFFKSFIKWFGISGNIRDKVTLEYRTTPCEKVYIHYIIDSLGCEKGEYITEEMQCVFRGLYIKSFTIFYGESIKYYVTENKSEEEVPTESSDYGLDDRNVEVNTTRFGMLNDILSYVELREESSIEAQAKKYYINKMLTEKLFQ